MGSILYIKSSSISDVRMNKFYLFLKRRQDYIFYFWGWDRQNKINATYDTNVKYLMKGIRINLIASYGLFIIKVFFKALFTNLKKYDNIICVNFESALPFYFVSKIKGTKYIYEIYDEFAKSYKFPKWLKNNIIWLDKNIMNRSEHVIHVDYNRIVGPEQKKVIVIENTPYDFWKGEMRNYSALKHRFVISGMFSSSRGMEQIYKFAKENENITFLLAGRFTDEKMKSSFLGLGNVETHEFIPQEKLFALMSDCCGIFSLYNPDLEINRLAASNKVYDAMMMGIPVITNKEVINAHYIEEQGIGVVVNYEMDESWDILKSESFCEEAKRMGVIGRELYLREYKFETVVTNRLLPILK